MPTTKLTGDEYARAIRGVMFQLNRVLHRLGHLVGLIGGVVQLRDHNGMREVWLECRECGYKYGHEFWPR